MPTADMPYDPGYSWRTTDKNSNMVAVGKVMADTLNKLGYNTVQDTTLHDYPSYNGSYDLSKETVEKYLEKYPSIKIVLDVHRDAVERNGSLINPVITSQGTKYAQIMIISGCDNGYMNMPNYRENLKFATNLQNQLAKDTSGLVRPILFDYRNYNQQLSTGSILVEIGTHGSTLQQAKNSAEMFAISLANMLDNM
jgi:stage II sporulation protein P